MLKFIIFFTLPLIFSIYSQEKIAKAKITNLIGKVSKQSMQNSESKNPWIQLKVNDEVNIGDTLSTGSGSIVTIIYKDSEFKLLQNTIISVKSLYDSEKDGNIEVQKGLAWFKLSNLKNKKFNSITPSSSAGVRGTAFASVYDENAKADLTCVCEGKVEVNPSKSGGKLTLVEKGNGVSVKVGETTVAPISYKGEMLKGESLPGFEKKINKYPILKNCLSCHTPKGWKVDGILKDESYGK